MDDLERYRRALRRIARLQPAGAVNEWSKADAFDATRQIAEDALAPGARESRLKEEEASRSAIRRQVNALRRNRRYFYVGCGAPDGAWVRFLRGDDESLGLVHVKVLERAGAPRSTWQPWQPEDLVVRVGDLQIAPGEPLIIP